MLGRPGGGGGVGAGGGLPGRLRPWAARTKVAGGSRGTFWPCRFLRRSVSDGEGGGGDRTCGSFSGTVPSKNDTDLARAAFGLAGRPVLDFGGPVVDSGESCCDTADDWPALLGDDVDSAAQTEKRTTRKKMAEYTTKPYRFLYIRLQYINQKLFYKI